MSIQFDVLVYTVIGAISMSLYIFLLASIIYFRRRKESDFCSSFFTIFISLAIADIGARITNQIFTILPYDANLQQFYLTAGNANGAFLAKYAKFSTYSFAYIQSLGHLLVAINRYTALSRPVDYDHVRIEYCLVSFGSDLDDSDWQKHDLMILIGWHMVKTLVIGRHSLNSLIERNIV
jgi:hypothetical protein